MEWLFGKKKTPAQMLRENKRLLEKTMRNLDRERVKMEQQEKKIIVDIKKMAKEGQMDAVKIMARDLVRTKRYVKKFIIMKANIQAVSLKISTLQGQDAMMKAMKGVTKAMRAMNKQMKIPQFQKIMQDFERQTAELDMKTEMMEDAVDDAMGGEEDEEEETNAIVKQVFDELGLQLNDELSGLQPEEGVTNGPTKSKAGPTAVGADTGPSMDSADADLEARLKNLRRD